MAVSILDASSNSGAITSFPANTTTFTKAFSAGAGNRIACFSIMWQNTAIATAITAISYGGQTPALPSGVTLQQNGGIGVAWYFLTNAQIAAASTSVLTITWNDTPDRAVISGICFDSATTPTGGTGNSGSSGTSAAVTPTGADANSYAVAAVTSGATTTIANGTTDFINVGTKFAGGARRSGATSTIGWTVNNGDSYAVSGFVVPDSGGGSSVFQVLAGTKFSLAGSRGLAG